MSIYGHRQSKPNPGVRLDRANPLNRGLVLDWTANEGAGSRVLDHAGLVTPATGTFSSGSLGWNNAGVNFPAGDFRVDTGVAVPGLPSDGSSPWALEVLVALASTTSLCAIWGFSGEVMPAGAIGHNNIRAFLAFGGSSPFHVYFWGNASDWDSGINWIVDGKPHHYVFTTPGGSTTPTISLYVDGIFRASGTPGAALAIAANNGLSDVFVGSRHTSGTGSFTGQFIRGRVYSRDLPRAEISALAGNPWQVYPSPQPYWLYPASAAPPPSFQPWIYGDQIGETYG